MRVAFDQQIFVNQEYGGISRYFCELVRKLAGRGDVNAKIFAPVHSNKYLRAMPQDLAMAHYVTKFRGMRRVITTPSRIIAKAAILRYRPDIFHETYYTRYDSCPPNARRVITVYDMIFEKFPDMFPDSRGLIAAKRHAVERADHVICISKSTREDLIHFFCVPEEKTSVVYVSHGELPPPVARTRSEQLPPGPFVLYVGERLPYKNFTGLMKAARISKILRLDYTIVCFGGGSLRAEEKQMIAQFGLRPDRVVQLSGSDSLLAEAYARADAFVYPSLYEGFGIPVLEAMAAGCPVACGNVSSLPEVAGGAAVYFNPLDSSSIAEAVDRILTSTELRSEMRERGYACADSFSWSRCSDETLAIYRSLM